MQRRKMLWAVLALLVPAQTLWAGLINGFESDDVYILKESGLLRLVRESDGSTVQDLLPDGTAGSLTFSGIGKNDARLFAAQVLDADGDGWSDDVSVFELNATGGTVKSIKLSAVAPGLPTPAGHGLTLGSIRYSPTTNSLYVSLAPDFLISAPNYPGVTPAKVFELDLGLTQLLHTYVGPTEYTYRNPTIALNRRSGLLYLTSQNLGQPGNTGLGDLVVFNTAGRPVGGTTTTYTTLVKGTSMGGNWNAPHAVIFRQRAGDGSDDTLVVTANPDAGGSRPAVELWLDTTAHPADANGNLAVRNPALINVARGWNGSQDPVTSNIWLGALRGGYHVIRADDTTQGFDTGRNYAEAASPPFEPCNKPFADADADGDVDQDDFAIFQLCFTGTNAGPVPVSPDNCACLDRGDDNNDGQSETDGDLDAYDFVAFQKCASGPDMPADPGCGG